jgi:hypothetical protein
VVVTVLSPVGLQVLAVRVVAVSVTLLPPAPVRLGRPERETPVGLETQTLVAVAAEKAGLGSPEVRPVTGVSAELVPLYRLHRLQVCRLVRCQVRTFILPVVVGVGFSLAHPVLAVSAVVVTVA